jgi:hypothetical protein
MASNDVAGNSCQASCVGNRLFAATSTCMLNPPFPRVLRLMVANAVTSDICRALSWGQ